MEILAVVGVVVLIIGAWYIGTYNSIKVLQLKVKEGGSGIDVALTKRYDVLTKMLDVVKGYQKHEKEVLMGVISLRQGMSISEKNQANKQMDKVASQISLMAEAYPELKSSNNFMELQKAIVDVEEHLQAARRLYNSNVNTYNSKIIVFPNSIVAGMMGAREEAYFEAEEMKRQDVSMTF